mmetsp:Transcript_33860/g.34495  ORF Transcript_33860/g.34495 Transcript_33860/m.34495 type:complete len:123 (+) Transcript_33860:106-474(+)
MDYILHDEESCTAILKHLVAILKRHEHESLLEIEHCAHLVELAVKYIPYITKLVEDQIRDYMLEKIELLPPRQKSKVMKVPLIIDIMALMSICVSHCKKNSELEEEIREFEKYFLPRDEHLA